MARCISCLSAQWDKTNRDSYLQFKLQSNNLKFKSSLSVESELSVFQTNSVLSHTVHLLVTKPAVLNKVHAVNQTRTLATDPRGK